MRNSLRVIFLVLFPLLTYAQYVPNSGQAFHFAPVYNPAFTGIENFVDAKLGYRYQWTGFKENAPQFGNLSVNIRTKQPLDLKENALRPSRTDFSKLVPKRKLSIHGAGLNVFNEKIGPVNRIGAGLHYAIHWPVTEKIFVSAGAGAMYESTNLDVESLYWGKDVKPEDDPVYNKLINGANKHGELWTRTGLLVYSDNFYIGGTYYPWSTSINSSDLAFNEAFYKAGVQAGFSLQLNEDYVVKPSVWALMQVDNAFVIDYNLKFYLEQKAWMGLTYRDIKAGIVSAGFNINEKLSVSYSYEFALGKLRTFGGGSHELILASRLKNFRKFNQRVW